MICEQVQQQIDAALDGELDPEAERQLDAHLAECTVCRNAAEELRDVDALLRRTLRSTRTREAAGAVADRVTGQISVAPRPRQAAPVKRWLPILAVTTTVAMLFVAVAVLGPWQDGGPQEQHVVEQLDRGAIQPGGDVRTDASASAVAHIVAATGPVDVLPAEGDTWTSLADPESYACTHDTHVRTPPGSLCELATPVGIVLRMRDETEVRLDSPAQVQLVRGHLWCDAPPAARLLVGTPGEDLTLQPAGSELAVFQCSSGVSPTVTASSGSVQVTGGGGSVVLESGRSVQLTGDVLAPLEDASPLLSSAWMHPLLTAKGHGHRDLTARVDELLAHVGSTKISLLYEEQIRGLGDYGALPLLRYIESAESRRQPERRLKAMTILADVAPVWMVPDLIALLDDDDARVQTLADRALVRLTGRESGMSEQAWRDDPSAARAARDGWRDWWADAEEGFVKHPERPTG